MTNIAWLVVAWGIALPYGSDDWTHLGSNPARVGWRSQTVSLSGIRWVASLDLEGAPIAFAGQTSPVTLEGRIYALGRSSGQDRLYALRRNSGSVEWQVNLPPPFFGSWSSPCVDAGNRSVLVGQGLSLRAVKGDNGAILWDRPLPRPIVNASPMVTTDLHPRDRAFITDYEPLGGAGMLYCVNVDPWDAITNPFAPGEVVWSVPLGGTSGNSPAYADGVVYVAVAHDESGLPPGRVLAFDARATIPPLPLWAAVNPLPLGFFGGVSAHEGSIYAASYAFAGGLTSANLVRFNAVTGEPLWTAACNRTSSIPLPLPGGLVAVSAGLRGFGTVPSVVLFRDDGTRLWDSALDTWHDVNANGIMDPGEYLAVGGWTLHPAGTASGLLIGTLPVGASTSAAPDDLYLLDLSRHPSEAGFVVAHRTGTGASPAISEGWVLSIGPGGLVALGPACDVDCNADGMLNLADFGCFQTKFALGDPWADCNNDGMLNLADFGCFQTRFALGCP